MRLQRWVPRGLRQVPPQVADAALALLVAAVASTDLSRPLLAGSESRPADALGHALVIAVCLPLVMRRQRPRTTMALVLAFSLLFGAIGYVQSAVGIPLLIAIFSLGLYCDLRRSAPLLVAVVVVYVLLYFASRDPLPPSDPFMTSVFFAVAFWLGASIRVRRVELSRQVVAEERLRIARELHDVVAHSMSVVAVQSGVAAHVLDTHPAQAKAALEVIASTSRDALDELRRLLDVLRPGTESAGALAPAPGLAAVPDLAAKLTEAGVPVTVQTTGEPADVPTGVDLTAYRIVQEALTNTFKHAGPGARADVRIDYRSDRLALEVADDGRGEPSGVPSGAGAGLAGMRERVGLFGGDLEVGPLNGRGWRVSATLPLRGESKVRSDA